MHFIFEISNRNLIVAAFSAVNESVWEHLKIIVLPTIIYSLIEYKYISNESKNKFSKALFYRIITEMIIVSGVFYFYTSIIGKSILVIDILLFFTSILASSIVSYSILNSYKEGRYFSIYSILVIILLLLFLIFTYVTPKFKLFEDETNNTYGVFKEF